MVFFSWISRPPGWCRASSPTKGNQAWWNISGPGAVVSVPCTHRGARCMVHRVPAMNTVQKTRTPWNTPYAPCRVPTDLWGPLFSSGDRFSAPGTAFQPLGPLFSFGDRFSASRTAFQPLGPLFDRFSASRTAFQPLGTGFQPLGPDFSLWGPDFSLRTLKMTDFCLRDPQNYGFLPPGP